jgi:hypothetical protein
MERVRWDGREWVLIFSFKDDQNKVKSSDISIWNNHRSDYYEEEGVKSEDQALRLDEGIFDGGQMVCTISLL